MSFKINHRHPAQVFRAAFFGLAFTLGFNEVAVASARAEEVGPRRLMLNLKMGASLGITANAVHSFALDLDAGFAVSDDGRARIVFSPGLQIGAVRIVGADTSFLDTIITVLVPLGFQYDIPMPVRGLYLYPRLTAGYAAAISRTETTAMAAGQTAVFHRGLLNGAFGIKYVIRDQLNVGLEPVNLMLFFNSNTQELSYRVLGYVGIDFGGPAAGRRATGIGPEERRLSPVAVGPAPSVRGSRFEAMVVQRSRIPDDGQNGKERPLTIEPQPDGAGKTAVGVAAPGGTFLLHEPVRKELTTARTSLAPDPADPSKLVEVQKDELDGRVRLSGKHRVPELGLSVNVRLTIDCNARPATLTIDATGGGKVMEVFELRAEACGQLRGLVLKMAGVGD